MDDTEEIQFNKITSSKRFYKEINDLVEKHDMDYIDAVLHFCQINNVEIESVASIIKNNLNFISVIQAEAEQLNYLPKTDRLPI